MRHKKSVGVGLSLALAASLVVLGGTAATAAETDSAWFTCTARSHSTTAKVSAGLNKATDANIIYQNSSLTDLGSRSRSWPASDPGPHTFTYSIYKSGQNLKSIVQGLYNTNIVSVTRGCSA